MPATDQVKLTPQVLGSLAIAQVHREHKARITSVDFDASGRYALTAGDDEVMCLYDCEVGRFAKLINSKKYGVQLARFLHRSTNVLYASTKGDDALRYMSTHDNSYIRYFRGHTARVVSLDINPVNDLVISAAEDLTVRLWDTRSPNCQGMIEVGAHSCAAFDPHGLVFAVASGGNTVRLYDSSNFDKGPFAVFRDIDVRVQRSGLVWTNIAFSPNGLQLLLSTNQDILLVLDAFTGDLVRAPLTGIGNEQRAPLNAAFAPDSRSVVCGAPSGNVHIWDLDAHQPTIVLPGHAGACNVARFNPRLALMASACTELAGGRGRPASLAVYGSDGAGAGHAATGKQAFWLPSDADGPLYGDDLMRIADHGPEG